VRIVKGNRWCILERLVRIEQHGDRSLCPVLAEIASDGCRPKHGEFRLTTVGSEACRGEQRATCRSN
jgi:hypothetical protein